jgi:hypothetical protein
MNNRKINLSGPTISPNTYAGNFGNKYIAAALLSGETLAKDLITVHPNVAFKEVIRNYQDSIVVADATCDFTDSSSVTLGEYVLTTVEKQVNLQLCKNNLRTTWEAASAGFSAHLKSYPQLLKNSFWLKLLLKYLKRSNWVFGNQTFSMIQPLLLDKMV